MPKILVADDEMDICEILRILLRGEGFKVATETRGDKVMERIEAFKPDVVLLDVNIPPLDGRNICLEIKKNYSIPVILFSANITVEKNYKDCMADSFVSKPFEIGALVNEIEAHLV